MKLLCCFDNPSTPLIIDASVAINLNATGCAQEVIKAIPHDVIMADIVCEELANGHCKGRSDAELTAKLVEEGLIKIVHLGEVGLSLFEQLVSGDASETLDDGEAATIALAFERQAIALIDERKATRICEERFASLAVASTVDLFAHPDIVSTLGREALAEAVFNALQLARMNVQPHHIDWVADLIGLDRVAECRSLPKSIRGTPLTVFGEMKSTISY